MPTPHPRTARTDPDRSGLRPLVRYWRQVAGDRWRLLTMLPLAGVRSVGTLLCWQSVTAINPVLQALAIGWLLEAMTTMVNDHTGIAALATPLGAIAGLLLLQQLAESAYEIASVRTARRIDGAVRSRVRIIAAAPQDIAHMAEPEFRNDAMRAGDLGYRFRTRSAGTAVTGQVLLCFRVIAAVAAAVVVARYLPSLAIALLVLSLAMRSLTRRQFMRLTELDSERATDERAADYWSELAGGSSAAKEIRVFQLADWVIQRRRSAMLAWRTPLWNARREVVRRQWFTALLAAACGLLAMGVPAYQAAIGQLAPEALVTCFVAGWCILGIGAMGYEAYDIEYGQGAVRALGRLEAQWGIDSAPGRSSAGAPVSPIPVVIDFDSVTFCYPQQPERHILHRLNLRIRPGEVIAIVGPNGAGKTTLVKLLTGLCTPTGGTIKVGGTDLADLDIGEWRSRITAVFQDFIRYPASANDNIALSVPEHLNDAAGVRDSLLRADAECLLAALPQQLDTMLEQNADGTADLSGGQWQKVAIARALFAVTHGRWLVVLDEPTAHLDMRAEAQFFDQLIAATAGASIILISHRLSSIRSADRIVLLSDGAVTEDGSHTELMTLDGDYARLFRLQASRFEEVGAQ